MFFIHLIPFFILAAYYDWKDRDIPEALIAIIWLAYSLSFAFMPFENIVTLILALILPMFGLGLFWIVHIIIEEIYKNKIVARKWIKSLRYGLADVFLLPLMAAMVIQLGGAYGVLWAVANFGWASLWFNDLKPGDRNKKLGIPILTFATAAIIFCVLAHYIIVPYFLK